MENTHENALKPGTRIRSFEIQNVLGAGGFGITYKAWDHQLECEVAIKEYLPNYLATRSSDRITVTVLPRSEDDNNSYKNGLKKFLDEARTLAKFRDTSVVGVKQFLSANGTAYMVMDYERGRSLTDYVKNSPPPLPEEELKRTLTRLLGGLSALHTNKILHRDIKPDNIHIRDNGDPVLLDFGSARQAAPEKGSLELTSMVTLGYAPYEQYHKRGNQGPWTDLYSLGATTYYCLAGKKPVDGMDRYLAKQEGWPDPLRPAEELGRGHYRVGFLRVIDWMLRIPVEDRPQNTQAVLDVLENRAKIPAPQTTNEEVITVTPVESRRSSDDEKTVILEPTVSGDRKTAPSWPRRALQKLLNSPGPSRVRRQLKQFSRRVNGIGIMQPLRTILGRIPPSEPRTARLVWGGIGLTSVLFFIVAPLAVVIHVETAVPALLAEAGHRSLKVAVSVDDVSASLLGGSMTLTGLRIANPEGFQSNYLVTVDSVTMQIDSGLWFGDVVHFREITVSPPVVSYERQAGKGSNLWRFTKALKEKQPNAEAVPEASGKSRRIIVDALVIQEGRVQAVTFPKTDEVVSDAFSELTFADLGKDAELDTADLLKRIMWDLTKHVQATVKSSRAILTATGRRVRETKSTATDQKKKTTFTEKLKKWFSTVPAGEQPEEEESN